MSFLKQNQMPLAFVGAVGLVLAVIVLVRSDLADSGTGSGEGAELPKIVDILAHTDRGTSKLEIRDPTAIVVMQSVFDGKVDVDSQPPGIRPFEVFFHPTNKSSYSYAPDPVWPLADGNYAWAHNGRVTRLSGTPADLVDWLKARRINQLRRDNDARQRKLGQQLRDAGFDDLSASLLRVAQSDNGWFAQAAIRELNEFVQAEPRPVDTYWPGRRYPAHVRNVRDPDRKVRTTLLQLVANSPQAAHADDPHGVAAAAASCLQMIGDRATADSLLKLLNRQQDGRVGEQVLTNIEKLYGIPKTYERFGICGNSTAEEMAEFREAQLKRQQAAIDDLTNWLADHAQDTDDEFADAVLERWSEVLVHIADNAPSYGLDPDRTPAAQIAALLELGPSIVPAMRRRQDAVRQWQEKALLEFAIAFITRDCNAEFVDRLLTGDFDQQRIGCSIIAATGKADWNEQLVELLRTPLPDSDVEKVVNLRDVAAQALFRSQGAEAVPEFRRALGDGFESSLVIDILKHLEVPVSQF